MQKIRLKKPKSRIRVEIDSDTKEECFLFVKRIENKTGKIKSNGMIVNTDLPDWMTYFLGSGWIIVED